MVNARLGVLSLQGCIDSHCDHLFDLGYSPLKVKTDEDLSRIDGLILPGGESSTMLRLLDRLNLFSSLRRFSQTKPCWGVCAGSILLAQEVTNPTQKSLAALPVAAHRNFYGSQLDSFKAEVFFEPLKQSLHADFIRAPRLTPLSAEVEVLAILNGSPVALRHDHTLVTSFHTELEVDSSLHKFFAQMVEEEISASSPQPKVHLTASL